MQWPGCVAREIRGPMFKLQLFNVSPSIPEELRFLETLSCNMWWCWNSDAIELFRRIDSELWTEVGHNPRRLLGRVPQKRFEALAADEGFLRHIEEVKGHYHREVESVRSSAEKKLAHECVAYFSLEYGIHESVRTYSGGLGVLAGDHLKACSDLGLPLVGVGLLYRQGYFQQYLTPDGWQQERYPEHAVQHLPVEQVADRSGQHVQIAMPLPDGKLHAIIWRLNVGAVPLFLLDTNIPDNPPKLRGITAKLYDSDRETRLQQELLLGVGGFRALLAMGINPCACHINEGHAAFLGLARLAHMVRDQGLSLDTALEIVPRTGIFTTHTPVPAGNETFPVGLVKPYLDALEEETGIPAETVISWGQAPSNGNDQELSMTILGLRMSQHANAVSRAHGTIASKMWAHLWPGRPENEVPITHVTNGIHVPSWLSPDNELLFGRYLGPDWRHKPDVPKILKGVAQIPEEELWRAHELGRSRLVRTVRERMEHQARSRNATRDEIAAAKSVLDHDRLTIGFARRFATYKRATLLLRDPDRLTAMLTEKERPVQIVFAGKAHPADNHGKELIRQIVHFSRRPEIRKHVVFLENYDIGVARRLVQGVDVWLNNPRRPQEASGTSGMKAAVNGALHLSVLDGWWCEGYAPGRGWALGHGEVFENEEYEDSVEAQALYNILENEVVPLFYDRPAGDMPTKWVEMMKDSIMMALELFTSHRMASEYRTRFYEGAVQAYKTLSADNAAGALRLVEQRGRLRALWSKVRVDTPYTDEGGVSLHVGDKFDVGVVVELGELSPDEVDVEVYYGPVDTQNNITETHVEKMKLTETIAQGRFAFAHEIICAAAGRYGFTARVTPRGADWRKSMPGFITWADDA